METAEHLSKLTGQTTIVKEQVTKGDKHTSRTLQEVVSGNRSEIIDRQHRTGTFNSPELNRALAEKGLIERAVPGLGKGDPIELFVLDVTALGGACFGLPTTLVSERERGVWRRYRLTPASTWTLLTSTVVAPDDSNSRGNSSSSRV